MKKSWNRGVMVLIAAGVLVLGAGIWRQSTQARNAPPPATATAASAPAKGATGVEAEFEAMVNGLREKLQGAADKRAVAGEIMTALQQFAAKHPNHKIADQARLTLGQLQMRLGHAPEAIITLRQVAEKPVDPKMGPVGSFYLAQALAMAGQTDLARQTLTDLSKSAADEQIRQASRQVLAQMTATSSVAPGSKPPAFQAKDLSGRPQSPDRYRGKVLLIDFWATWCGPCIAEMPNVKAVYDKYKDRGFAILGVSLDQDRSAVENYVKSGNLAWPQLCDGKGWKNAIARQYGVTSIPRTVLIDRKGVIRHVDLRGNALETAVAALVNQKPG